MVDSPTIALEIVTPESKFYSKQVYMATLPGSGGEFGILYGHMYIMSGLKPGLVTVYDTNMQIIDHIFISYGFAEITDKTATLLVEEAGHLTDYDIGSISEELIRHNDNLEFCKNDSDTAILNNKIQYAEILIDTLKRFKDNEK